MSNHIDHIEITNFKSIRHQKIEGCKRINVFIGYPNVGKSAILEAISMLSYLKPDFSEPFSKLCRLKNSNEIFYNANIKENAIIKYTDEVELYFHYIKEFLFSFYIDIYSEDRLKNRAGNPWEIFREISYSENIFNEPTPKGINSPEVLKIIKKLVRVKKYVFNGADSFNEFKTNGLSLASPHGENLVDIIQFNKELRKEVGELFKFYDLKLLIDQATNSIRGLKQLYEETIFTVPFYQMADTLQRLIFHKAAIMSNQDTVLLFEEPEAHMFPPYIGKFTSDVIFFKTNQYFISTHSPFVINDFIEDAKDDLAIYLVGLENGETIIKKMTEEQVTEVYQYGVDLFFNLESYLRNG